MFKNIGRKIKGFAKFLFWLTIIGFSIAALVVIVFTVNDRNSSLIGILVAIGLIVAGIILGWLQNFLLYGYGELIDSTQKILEELESRSVSRPAPQAFSYAQPQPAQEETLKETIANNNQ